MASASEWVRQTIARAQESPIENEALLKSLEKHVGQGDRMLERVDDVLNYIDGELACCRFG